MSWDDDPILGRFDTGAGAATTAAPPSQDWNADPILAAPHWQPRPTLPPDEPQLDLQTRAQIQNYAPTQPTPEQYDQSAQAGQLRGIIGQNAVATANAPYAPSGFPQHYDPAQQDDTQAWLRQYRQGMKPQPEIDINSPEAQQTFDRTGVDPKQQSYLRSLSAGYRYVPVPRQQFLESLYGMGWEDQQAYKQENSIYPAGDGSFLVREDLAHAFAPPQTPEEQPQNTAGQEARNVGANVGAAIQKMGSGLVGMAGTMVKQAGGSVTSMGRMFPTVSPEQGQEPLRTMATAGGEPVKQAGEFVQRQAEYGMAGAEQTQRDLPVQTGAGKLGVGVGTLLAQGAISSVVPGGFTATFAAGAAGETYANARAQGDDPETAMAKGMTSAISASLTPKIAEVLGPEAGQAAAQQVARAYLGTGSMIAAQQTLDELTLKAGTDRPVDLSQILPEALSQGAVGVVLHGRQIAATFRGSKNGHVRVMTAEEQLTRPPETPTPQFAEGDYGTGLRPGEGENVALRASGEPAKPNEALTGAQNEPAIPGVPPAAQEVPPAALAAGAVEEGAQAPAGAGAGGEEAVGSHPPAPTPTETPAGTEAAAGGEPARKLYREVSPYTAQELVGGIKADSSFGPPQHHFADTPDLALGQGENKGVVAEFDRDGLEKAIAATGFKLNEYRGKPGLQTDIPGFGKEFVGKAQPSLLQKFVTKFTIKPDAEPRFAKRLRLMLNRDRWTKETNADGSISYSRPEAVNTSSERMSAAEVRALGVPQELGPSDNARGGVSPPFLSGVKPGVLARSDQAQVLDPVIRLVPVDVVNMLGGKERASQMLLHDPAMFADATARTAGLDVARRIGDSVGIEAARLRAKLGASDLGGKREEVLSALGAFQQRLLGISRTARPDSGNVGGAVAGSVKAQEAGSGAEARPPGLAGRNRVGNAALGANKPDPAQAERVKAGVGAESGLSLQSREADSAVGAGVGHEGIIPETGVGGGVSGGGEVSPDAQSAAEKVGYDVPPDLLGGVLQSSPTKAVYRGEGPEPAKPAEGVFARNVTRFRGLIDEGKRAAGKMFPTLNRLGESSGDAASHYVASKIYAKEAAPVIAHEVIGTTRGGKIDERVDKLAGAALVQDNLDTLRKERTAAGEDVSGMADLIGAEGSPFATRTDYALALKDPDVRAAIERYKEWFKNEADPNFRAAQGIAPGEDLPTRGEITGARVNLMAVRPEDPQTKTTVYGASRDNLTNVKLKPSPFARKAKGTGEGYEISLSKMIENTLGKGTEIANQHRLYEQLVKDKIAVIGRGGERPLIDGKPTRPLEIESARRFVTSQKGDEGTKTSGFTQPAKKLFIRADAYGEVYRAANVEEPFKIPVLSTLGTGLNKAALSSASEGMFHLANQLSVLVRTPGTGMVLPQMVKKGIQLWRGGPEVRKQLVELARIGALKEERSAAEGLAKLNPLGLMGKVIAATDRIGRLVVDDAFTKLAEKGIVENTEQNRRDLVNQFGQYNRRAQERFIAWLRDSNVNPFATAAANFSAIGWKNLTFSPGMKATSYANALRLRATLLARFAVPLAMVGVSNYLAWGRVDGSANIPIGSLRLPDDKDGKLRYVNVLDILGPTRGLRNSGLLAMIEGKRKGLSGSEIFDKAGADVWRGAVGPLQGPLVRTGMVAGTGHDLGGFQVAKTAEKGEPQTTQNLKAAALGANPLIDLMTGGRNSQFGKFEVKTANKKDQSQAEMLADRLSAERLKGLSLAPSDKAKHDAREKLVEQVRKAGTDQEKNKLLDDAVAAKQITGMAQRNGIVAESQRTPLANKAHGMELGDAMAVWDETYKDKDGAKARQGLRLVMLRKIEDTFLKSPGKHSPEEWQAMRKKINEGSGWSMDGGPKQPLK